MRHVFIACLALLGCTALLGCADAVLDSEQPPDLFIPSTDARLDRGPAADSAVDARGLPDARSRPDARPTDARVTDAHAGDARMQHDARLAQDAAPPPVDQGPPLPCDPGFEVLTDGADRILAYRNAQGFTYVGMRVLEGGAPNPEWIGIDRPEGPDGVFRWRWRVRLPMGRWTAAFSHLVDDPDNQPDIEVARCSFRVVDGDPEPAPEPAPQPDPEPGPCQPSCAGVICGGPDGCGGRCTGGRRGNLGAASDCRGNGDCGCGARGQADNMSCMDDGRCLVRCECDCLPGGASPIDAADVAGMNFAQSCSLALQRSGDPTIWDYDRNVPLCPTGDLPDGQGDAFYCQACPPCHRATPPACSQAQYCACTDPDYRARYPQYNATCGPVP